MLEKLNEAEIKNLLWFLLHGGDVLRRDWHEWRRTAGCLRDTDLRSRGFVEVYAAGRERVRITEKGRKAVEEST